MALTSISEGFGLVLAEAQSRGLPCVSFHGIGQSEIIRDNVNGFLIDMGDIDAFADKLYQLMTNEDLLRKFSENAYIGHERYQIDHIRQQWIDIIEKVCAKGK